MNRAAIRKEIESTYKSNDTEEWVDVKFTRPVGFWWAQLFKKIGATPNVVTVISMFVGALAGVMFYFSDIGHNVAGVLLLMWANLLDSADGQLARMTGKITAWGRILDGFAGDIWFFSIYMALAFRMSGQAMPWSEQTWGLWAFGVFALSGFVCHSKQSQLADYYRTIHLWCLPGSKTEIQESTKLKEEYVKISWRRNFLWKFSSWGYVDYTRAQESITPECQKLLGYLRKETAIFTEPDGKETKEFKARLRAESKPLLRYGNILTFNTRALVLYVACLADVPWVYAAFEIVVLSLVFVYLRHRHERICKGFYEEFTGRRVL